MGDSTLRSRFRRQILLLAPAAFTASFLRGQNGPQNNGPNGAQNNGPNSTAPGTYRPPPQVPLQNPDNRQHADDSANADNKRQAGKAPEIRQPNEARTDAILKADYEKNLKDARDLTGLARGFEQDLVKSDARVFSLTSLKKLDDMELLTKRIRTRMKRS